jgi:hypothetical protein
MLLLVLLLLTCIASFTVGLLSPRRGTKIQDKSLSYLQALLKKLRTKPSMAQAIVGKPSMLSHKSIHKSASLGKKVRAKLK